VKLRIRAGGGRKDKIENGGFKLQPAILVAEADLRPNEIQDLAERLPEIRKATATSNLKLHFRLELDGLGKAPAGETIAKLNELLTSISKQLVLK
jgi:hypothetical protein